MTGTREKFERALMVERVASSAVLFRYQDDEERVFYLPTKERVVRSPYSGYSLKAPKPSRISPSKITEELKSQSAPDKGDVGSKVRSAFQELKQETGRNRVLISELQKKSKVPMADLHKYLDAECTAHRANPSRGEFTAAIDEQKKGALDIDGEPHLYIELL